MINPPRLGDEQAQAMIADILRGNRNLFHELIVPYEGAVYRLAFCLLGESAAAEEIAFEVFLKAYRELASVGNSVRFSTWLIGMTVILAKVRAPKQESSEPAAKSV